MGKEKKDERDSPGESRCAISLRIRGIESVGGVAEIRKKHRREGRMRQGKKHALTDYMFIYLYSSSITN